MARLLLRLHDDARRCVEADTMYAPCADAARHDAGILYEAKLADRLQELGLSFLTEDDLRAKVVGNFALLGRLQTPVHDRGFSRRLMSSCRCQLPSTAASCTGWTPRLL